MAKTIASGNWPFSRDFAASLLHFSDFRLTVSRFCVCPHPSFQAPLALLLARWPTPRLFSASHMQILSLFRAASDLQRKKLAGRWSRDRTVFYLGAASPLVLLTNKSVIVSGCSKIPSMCRVWLFPVLLVIHKSLSMFSVSVNMFFLVAVWQWLATRQVLVFKNGFYKLRIVITLMQFFKRIKSAFKCMLRGVLNCKLFSSTW